MKVKRFIPLLLLGAMSLVCCSKKTYSGKYIFQMGKDKGVHMSAVIDLSTDAFELPVKDISDPLKFSFSVDINNGDGSDSDIEGMPTYQTIFEILKELIGDDEGGLGGYYKVGDALAKDKRLLTMGFVIQKEKIVEVVNENLPEGEDPITVDDVPDIPDDLMQKLMYSNIDYKQVYLTVPVSLPDVLIQLYWYGYDICIGEGGLEFNVLDESQHHPYGTHPTADDIAAINADPEYKANHDALLLVGAPYPIRDYHTLTIGLLKE